MPRRVEKGMYRMVSYLVVHGKGSWDHCGLESRAGKNVIDLGKLFVFLFRVLCCFSA